MSNTGWTWQHVRSECDLPTYFALCDWWHEVPPPAVQLRRIASFLGMQPGASPETPRMAQPSASATPSTQQDIAMAAAMAGMRAFEGRMADPMLDLID
ncbi:hypothetical protein [Limnohabitans lacus]|uniref:Sulfotransferase n=1 Tax=Limnohabitans lacus TaxID=3045173 RepID=A0ABT6X866_9BURK|nr:hypothetical protein [Limnohabitans sp. HM2-2]MDI9234313.1 hypothetical protein [Limnohabitans sp. HM2-2]